MMTNIKIITFYLTLGSGDSDCTKESDEEKKQRLKEAEKRRTEEKRKRGKMLVFKKKIVIITLLKIWKMLAILLRILKKVKLNYVVKSILLT